MEKTMLEQALAYQREGLCVIPCKSRAKAPALQTWEEYQHRISTRTEVLTWFGNSHNYNIGIVHGAISQNYVTLDFDHDAGLFTAMKTKFPELFVGRIEQSGSEEGFHLPLRVETLPNLGYDQRRDRPKGNKTWRTSLGICNVRASHCQTVAPPSVHPSGNLYHFIQKGPITTTATLTPVIAWLTTLVPVPAQVAVTRRSGGAATNGKTMVEAVKNAWDTVGVFKQFGLVGETRREPNGETRLLGNGGLLVAEDKDTWYNFSAEEGGGVLEAWAWCRYGSVGGKRGRFREMLLEMAQAANLDVAQFYKRGDEAVAVGAEGDRQRWSKGCVRWGRVRA